MAKVATILTSSANSKSPSNFRFLISLASVVDVITTNWKTTPESKNVDKSPELKCISIFCSAIRKQLKISPYLLCTPIKCNRLLASTVSDLFSHANYNKVSFW